MARVFPPFTPTASQTKVRDAAHAKSRTLSATNRHVNVPNWLAGREAGSRTSSGPRIITVVGLVLACASRLRWVGGQHLRRVLKDSGGRDDHVGRAP